jgi:hypothetical protein
MAGQTSTASANAPVHSIRKHSMKVAIWRNETPNGVAYNATLIRTYKDGDAFKDTTSLGFHDLANAAKLLLDAETWIAGQIGRDKAAATQTPSATAPTGRKGSRNNG